MLKKFFLFSSFSAFFGSVHAHCPLCTAAVGTALVSAEYFGFGSGIVGIFAGAFAVSTGLWVSKKIKKQFIPLQSTAIVLASFFLTIIPLLYLSSSTIYLPLLLFGESGTAFNKIYFVSTFLLSSIFGAFLSFLALLVRNFIKKFNGKVLFPFQGIALTLLFLFFGSLALALAGV